VSSPSKPNTSQAALRAHHMGVAVRDMDSSMAFYSDALGLRLLSGPFDDPIQKVRVCFIGSGRPDDAVIELISPLPSPVGDDAPIQQFLRKELGAYHICYEVQDIASTIADLRAKGSVLISGPVPAVAFGGRSIAWLFLPTRHLVELVEGTEVRV
jgi:methylmalonyl-CoA/ethylmalonyl-CoA epimerase